MATNDQQRGDADDGDGSVVRSRLGFTVVGIGASAGGIPALQTFFQQTPASSGNAFVVVLHLSPSHESHLDQIIQRATAMTVVRVSGSTPIERDHVYVIPPAQYLEMSDGHLHLRDASAIRGRPTTIDVFFRTLAEAHREHAVAVVLSGSGSDGAVGISRIKECGGLTFVQMPDEAGDPGMPRAAIGTGTIDFVMNVAEMPAKVIALAENGARIRLPSEAHLLPPAQPLTGEAALREADQALRELLALVRARTRHDFQQYKRGTVLRRIERRLQVNGLADLPSYRDFVRGHVDETAALLQDLLISVTNFFRDPPAFDALENALPRLLEHRPAGDSLRVWVTGCATGEEAYSIAMLVTELVDRQSVPVDVQVFATDIDERAISIARTGLYPSSIAGDVAPERLQRFFTKEGDYYRVTKPLRETVLFAVHNVLHDPPFSRIDLVCCRNLLIYLDRPVQTEVLETFRFALRGSGLLFLGSSESADGAANAYVAVDKRHRLYCVDPRARPSAARVDASAPAPFRLPAPTEAIVREVRSAPNAKLHQDALDQHAPPSVLIDRDQNILHVSASAARYLKHSGGSPSLNLLANVDPQVRLELRTALFRSAQSGRSVEARAVKIEREGRPARVTISVLPVGSGPSPQRNLLIVFTEVEETLAENERIDPASESVVVAHLEAEIRRLRQSLQETVEDAETSTEELTASNEEQQAVNEELRSTTEELETSKEELQSINEELATVNFELKLKVDETAQVNDDLRNLIASTDIATVFVDNMLRIKRFTPRALDVFSLIPGDVGRPLLDISNRVDYPELASDVAAAFDELKATERRVDSIDGRHYLARVLPYRTNDDKIEGAVLTFIDTTPLALAEERARTNEEQLRLVAETTRDYAILTTDEAGAITTWNAGAERVFGYTEREALDQSIAMLFVPEDRAEGYPQVELEVARRMGRAEDDRWHLRKDGSRIFCSGVTTPFASGPFRGFAKIARDVTDVKHEQAGRDAMLAREQIARARTEAAIKLKDDLLAVVSHELKHPLNLILVNAELLTRMPAATKDAGVERAVQIIRNAVIGQGKIIDDLLDLSRSRTGKLTLELERVELVPAIETIVATLRGDATANDIDLRLEIGPNLRPVRCDAVRLDQIVWNLLSNALKFTGAGGRVVVRLDSDGAEARISVSDTGRGIAPEFLTQIFDMFTQEHRGFTRSRGGLGIGLALAKDLAIAQGGRIEATSAGVGHGATFRVWLPFHDETTPRRPKRPTQNVLERLSILVVDDSADSLRPFVELLRLEGAEAVGADSGAEALRLVGERSFDVLISDLAMPEIDGFSLIEMVRGLPGGEALIAIALSGFGREKDRRDAIAAGFDAHLKKPLSIDDLQRVIRRLRRRRP